MDGLVLATTIGRIILVDADAAGHGWFVDETPDDDSEFVDVDEASPVNDHIDLQTVLLHELGHVLELSHDGSGGLMDGTLATETRHSVPVLI